MAETLHAADRELARRLLRGDERAFEAFFDAYFARLFRFAAPRLGSDPDATEDVVQATLERAIARLATYRGEAALFTWLVTFCRHEISAHYRRAGRRPVLVALSEDRPEVASTLESLSSLAGGPEEAARRAELARSVHVVLDRLPERYASALEWKYVDGLSVAEIALRLGGTTKAAESLLTRAREAFRDGFSTLARSRPGLQTEGA